jgi:hypothetical protein
MKRGWRHFGKKAHTSKDAKPRAIRAPKRRGLFAAIRRTNSRSTDGHSRGAGSTLEAVLMAAGLVDASLRWAAGTCWIASCPSRLGSLK